MDWATLPTAAHASHSDTKGFAFHCDTDKSLSSSNLLKIIKNWRHFANSSSTSKSAARTRVAKDIRSSESKRIDKLSSCPRKEKKTHQWRSWRNHLFTCTFLMRKYVYFRCEDRMEAQAAAPSSPRTPFNDDELNGSLCNISVSAEGFERAKMHSQIELLFRRFDANFVPLF